MGKAGNCQAITAEISDTLIRTLRSGQHEAGPDMAKNQLVIGTQIFKVVTSGKNGNQLVKCGLELARVQRRFSNRQATGGGQARREMSPLTGIRAFRPSLCND